ncbi:hypothetical protein ABIB26_003221 [Arthrobacter sp. UYEF20]
MYLVDARAYEHRSPHFSIWFRTMIRRHLIPGDPHPTYSRFDHLDGLPGPTGSTYRKRIASGLEQAWRDGEISYRDACHGMEELDGEP